MKDQDLIRMANQIAKAFAAYPQEEAVQETYTHIRSFWDPRMRQQIVKYVAAGGEGLEPVAIKAIQELKDPASTAEMKIG